MISLLYNERAAWLQQSIPTSHQIFIEEGLSRFIKCCCNFGHILLLGQLTMMQNKKYETQ